MHDVVAAPMLSPVHTGISTSWSTGSCKRAARPFSLRSPEYSFVVQTYSYDSLVFWVFAVLVCLMVFCLIRSMTAKMQGTLNTDGKKQMLHTKTYQSPPGYKNQYTLKAKKTLSVEVRNIPDRHTRQGMGGRQAGRNPGAEGQACSPDAAYHIS